MKFCNFFPDFSFFFKFKGLCQRKRLIFKKKDRKHNFITELWIPPTDGKSIKCSNNDTTSLNGSL